MTGLAEQIKYSIDTLMTRERMLPVVTVTHSQSLDGSITGRRGTQVALSDPASNVLAHKLRAYHKSILVGINTVLVDDPQLTVRLVEGANPIPLVLDSELKIPLDCKLVENAYQNGLMIFTSHHASTAKETSLVDQGASVIRQDGEDGLHLLSILRYLKEEGIGSVMVEGGAQVITSFLSENLFDHLIIRIAPKIVGGVRAVQPHYIDANSSILQFEHAMFEPIGRDIIFWGSNSPIPKLEDKVKS